MKASFSVAEITLVEAAEIEARHQPQQPRYQQRQHQMKVRMNMVVVKIDIYVVCLRNM